MCEGLRRTLGNLLHLKGRVSELIAEDTVDMLQRFSRALTGHTERHIRTV